MQKLGRHLIVEYYGCDFESLTKVGYIKQQMLTAAKKIGAKIVGNKFHQFSPQGVSGAVILAESHISIHTWPEYNYAAVDFFTCGGHCDSNIGVEFLEKSFQATSKTIQDIARGLPEDLQNSLASTF